MDRRNDPTVVNNPMFLPSEDNVDVFPEGFSNPTYSTAQDVDFPPGAVTFGLPVPT